MKEERIAELEALCQQATEGPWRAVGEAVFDNKMDARSQHPSRTSCIGRMNGWEHGSNASENNARFSAESRTALPEALAEVRQLRATLQRIEGTWTGSNDPSAMARALDAIDAECMQALTEEASS